MHVRSRPSPKRPRDPERDWYRWPTLWLHGALVLLGLLLMWRNRHSPWLFMLSVVPLLVDALVAPSALRPMALAAMRHRALGGMLGTWTFLVGLAAIAAAVGFVAAAFSFWALGVGALLVAYGVTSCWVGVQLVGRAPEDLEEEPIFRRLSDD